jgi:hypothetical protein
VPADSGRRNDREFLNCYGDDYEYFGPGCRYTWHTCYRFPDDGDANGVLTPELRYTIECRNRAGSMVCDCLDQGRLVCTISAPSNICYEQPPGVNPSPPLDEVYQPFLRLGV